MRLDALFLPVILVLSVSACTFGGDGGRPAPAPEPAAYEPLPPPQPAAVAGSSNTTTEGSLPSLGSINQGGTYPYGSASGASTGEGTGGAGESVVVRAPDGTLWRSARAGNAAQYQADAGACHQYAKAQSRHDSRIYDDRNAASDTLTTNSGFAQVQQQREEYSLYQRRFSLMEDCMRSRGYFRF